MKKGIEEGKVRKIEGKKARMKGRMVWKGEKEERRRDLHADPVGRRIFGFRLTCVYFYGLLLPEGD